MVCQIIMTQLVRLFIVWQFALQMYFLLKVHDVFVNTHGTQKWAGLGGKANSCRCTDEQKITTVVSS